MFSLLSGQEAKVGLQLGSNTGEYKEEVGLESGVQAHKAKVGANRCLYQLLVQEHCSFEEYANIKRKLIEVIYWLNIKIYLV